MKRYSPPRQRRTEKVRRQPAQVFRPWAQAGAPNAGRRSIRPIGMRDSVAQKGEYPIKGGAADRSSSRASQSKLTQGRPPIVEPNCGQSRSRIGFLRAPPGKKMPAPMSAVTEVRGRGEAAQRATTASTTATSTIPRVANCPGREPPPFPSQLVPAVSQVNSRGARASRTKSRRSGAAPA